jgi:hypothetical protein
MPGYYKIVFTKVENINTVSFDTSQIKTSVANISLTDEDERLNTSTATQLETEYNSGNAIVFSYKFYESDDTLAVAFGAQKDHKGVDINFSNASLIDVGRPESRIAQVVIFDDGMILIEATKQFDKVLSKLNAIIGLEIQPYVPNHKVIKRFYENAASINYLKLDKIGQMPPNPGPSRQETEALIRELGQNSKHITIKGKRDQDLKRSELVNTAEIYSNIIETTGKTSQGEKFSITTKLDEGEKFYGVSISKPKEESLGNFKNLCDRIKNILDRFSGEGGHA